MHYSTLSVSDDPFLCFLCLQAELRTNIGSLKETIGALRLEIASLKAGCSCHDSKAGRSLSCERLSDHGASLGPGHSVNGSSCANGNVLSTLIDSSSRELGPSQSVNSTSAPGCANSNVPSTCIGTSLCKLDNRQLNIVVHGIPECTKGQPRKQRWVSDLRNVSNLFNESSASVPKSAIRDCRRLGKYSGTSSRPRPILVHFNSCNVVMDLLQKRSLFSPPYVIKPDLPADVRLWEKALLKVRWDLVLASPI